MFTQSFQALVECYVMYVCSCAIQTVWTWMLMMSVRERLATHNVSPTHDTCSPTVVAPALNVHLNRQVI